MTTEVVKHDRSGNSVPPPILIRVEIERIRCHGRNPRRLPNPEHERIRASIRTLGLDQPLVVTREPGSPDYILCGGSTRLRILRELFEETGDERFRRANCIVRPWEGESGVLFAHLRDNELHGGLAFIDRALAVLDARSLLEREHGVERLGPHRLEVLFRERGLGLGQAMISVMLYAAEALWPVIPQALSAGLDLSGVEGIRDLEHAARAIWVRREPDGAAPGDVSGQTRFQEVFNELCRRYDGPEWDIEPLRDALEYEISEELDQVRALIRLELEAELDSGRLPLPDPCPVDRSHHGGCVGNPDRDMGAAGGCVGDHGQE